MFLILYCVFSQLYLCFQTCIIEKLQKQKRHFAMLTKALKDLVCRESFNVVLEKIGLEESESTGNEISAYDKSSNEKEYMVSSC